MDRINEINAEIERLQKERTKLYMLVNDGKCKYQMTYYHRDYTSVSKINDTVEFMADNCYELNLAVWEFITEELHENYEYTEEDMFGRTHEFITNLEGYDELTEDQQALIDYLKSFGEGEVSEIDEYDYMQMLHEAGCVARDTNWFIDRIRSNLEWVEIIEDDFWWV